MDHAYNDPDISPLEFMFAVLHDPTVPTITRLEAARTLALYVPLNPPKHVTIHITGGIPKYLDEYPPCVDINDCINRTTPCPWSAIMRSIQGYSYKPCKEQIDSGMVPIAQRKDIRLQ
jgi:hypothetical protein